MTNSLEMYVYSTASENTNTPMMRSLCFFTASQCTYINASSAGIGRKAEANFRIIVIFSFCIPADADFT